MPAAWINPDILPFAETISFIKSAILVNWVKSARYRHDYLYCSLEIEFLLVFLHCEQ